MYELPDSMNNRFILYLNILPVVEQVGMYSLFLGGATFLIWSVVKILVYPQTQNATKSHGQWFEAEMEKKRLNLLDERSANKSLRIKEMDVYYNSLLCPSKEACSDALQDLPCLLKEDIV